jgi:uncharacterized protein (TIGR00369 family)
MSGRTRWEAARAGAFEVPATTTLGFVHEPTPDPTDHVAISWTVPPEYCNSAGNLQGGVMAAFADALLGGATAAHLPEDQYPALAEMKISIFRPAPAGTKLTGRGYIVKSGKRVLFAEAEITDGDGKLIAKASGTEIPAEA